LTKVSLLNINKAYGEKNVLKDVSIEFLHNSFNVILGPPAAGKTTLLRIIAGLEKPTSGTIMFDDVDVTSLPVQQREVAFVFQSFALWPHMTAYENIASPLIAKGLSKSQIEEKVMKVASLLKIEGLLQKRPPFLSGGERQRVAIARALVKDAKIYLLDEPLANLDFKIREIMRSELKKLFESAGSTVIYASPDPLDAFAMAEYVVIINEGVIEQFGKLNEVYNKPKNVVAARLLGLPPINIINANLEEKDGKIFLNTGAFSVDFSKYKEVLAKDKQYLLGIRPNKIRFVEKISFEIPGLIIFKAKVLISEIIGSETIVHLESNSTTFSAYLPETCRLSPGDEVKLAIDPRDIFIFDKLRKETLIYAESLQEGV